MNIEIKDYTGYEEKEILPLYASVGWTAYTDQPDTLREGFARSLLILAAYDADRLIGLIRAVLERFAQVRQIGLATDDTPETAAFYRSVGFCKMSEIRCCGFFKTQK